MVISRIGRIIEVRQKKKEEKEKELKEIKQAIEKTKEEIRETGKEYERRYRELLCGPIDGCDFNVIRDYLYSLEIKEKELIERLNLLVGKAEKLGEELLFLHREIKKLEKLKERAILEKKREESRRAQKIIDDIALRSKEA